LFDSYVLCAKNAKHVGDDVGDQFLQEVGVARLYESQSVLQLADYSFKLTTDTIRGSSDMPPTYFSAQQQHAVARFTLGETLADSLSINPTIRIRDKLLVYCIKTVMFADYLLLLLYPLTVYRMRLVNDFGRMRRILNAALLRYGKGAPKYRLFIARKKPLLPPLPSY
jgi:hypothetical protein